MFCKEGHVHKEGTQGDRFQLNFVRHVLDFLLLEISDSKRYFTHTVLPFYDPVKKF